MTTLKNIAIAFFALTIFSTSASAQTLKAVYASNKINSVEPIKVKYLGDDGEYLLFHVELQSTKPTAAIFAIDDELEGELYSAGVNAARKVQTVKVEKRDAGQVINFRLVEGKATYSKSFSINTTLFETTSVAETAVTML